MHIDCYDRRREEIDTELKLQQPANDANSHSMTTKADFESLLRLIPIGKYTASRPARVLNASKNTLQRPTRAKGIPFDEDTLYNTI